MINVELHLTPRLHSLIGFAIVELDTPHIKFMDIGVHVDPSENIFIKLPVKKKFSKSYPYYKFIDPAFEAEIVKAIKNKYDYLIAESVVDQIENESEG